MEPLDQIEVIETRPKKSSKNFWKGALFGALAMFVVCFVLGGTLVIFSLMKNSGDVLLSDGRGGTITEKTENKLEMIRELIEQYYLYYDELDEDALQDSIISGYVNGLKEPYSVYYNEAETTARIYRIQRNIRKVSRL
mgnify:CR=1 FL=1